MDWATPRSPTQNTDFTADFPVISEKYEKFRGIFPRLRKKKSELLLSGLKFPFKMKVNFAVWGTESKLLQDQCKVFNLPCERPVTRLKTILNQNFQ